MTALPATDVVLLGIGHTNAHVLRMWRMRPLKATRLTCVSNEAGAPTPGCCPACWHASGVSHREHGSPSRGLQRGTRARTPNAGVYAVRQGPVLWTNIERTLSGAPILPYVPQRRFLKLLNTGALRNQPVLNLREV